MSRVVQSTGFLTDLTSSARNGRLAPASFQRPYVWEKADVEKLWTSIVKGYPVGAFLVWSPPPEVDVSVLGRGRLGPIVSDRDARPGLLLDGQNRLATFAWSIASTGTAIPADEIARIEGYAPFSAAERAAWLGDEFLAADPIERTVRFRPRAEAEGSLLVPAGVAMGSSSLNRFVRTWEAENGAIPDAWLYWLDNILQRAVGEARVTVTTLDRMPAAEALEAFRHIARTGVPMSDEDFEAAMAFAL